ncbi:MAG: hypothetical protein AAF802_33100 [Planctomycetota bacterium]
MTLHPILESPHLYDVVGFNYQRPINDEPFVDVTLRLGDTERCLRFFNPSELELEVGFPMCSGLQITDVSDRQLSGIRVRVDCVEPITGAMRFWAREVVDRDTVA